MERSRRGRRKAGFIRTVLLLAGLWTWAAGETAAGERLTGELYGYTTAGEELHRLLVRGPSSRTVLRIHRRQGDETRFTAAGEGSWYVWGTMYERGLCALMADPLALSFTSSRRTGASGLRSDIGAEPARRSGFALRIPETAGVYLLRVPEHLRWGGWMRLQPGAGLTAEAALAGQTAPQGAGEQLRGGSAILPDSPHPLRGALRLCAVEGPLKLRGAAFLSLSTFLPPGWAGSLSGELSREYWQFRGGAGLVGGAYADDRGELLWRRFRGEGRCRWEPVQWLRADLRGGLRMFSCEEVEPAEVLLETEGEAAVAVGGPECGAELRLGGEREDDGDGLPERQRLFGTELWAGGGGLSCRLEWERRQSAAGNEDRLQAEAGISRGGWRGVLEAGAVHEAEEAPEGSAELELEYRRRDGSCRLWAELGWVGELRPPGKGPLGRGEVSLTLGYEAQGPLGGER